MISKAYSAIPYGYSGSIIEVECNINRGLPGFSIVGMADKTINESRERVKSAIQNSSFSFPDKKITINLAPADLQKDGSYLDVPITLSILVSSLQLSQKDIENKIFVGELSLDGKLRPVKGIINIVETAKEKGFEEIFIPQKNIDQASLIKGIKIIAVENLQQLFLHLKKEITINPIMNVVKKTKTSTKGPLLDHVRGQALAKRAITIAIAGHHNILISGPPGAGKTLLAKVAANLLPDLSPEEQIAITKINSIANLSTQIISERPFRAPHHTASPVSIIGGGPNALPGEISLAHYGVLFLDEIPEYPRSVLEALRQPLEDKTISISRANKKTTYPADFMLIATMNPCPCGYAGDPTHECTCTSLQIENYRKKLSGPLFDRIDINIDVQKVENADLSKKIVESTHEHDVVKNKIKDAVQRQRIRYGKENFYNGSLSSHEVSTMLHLTEQAEQLLYTASNKLNLSARSYFKIIKVAQTIADLESNDGLITDAHISEALSYRKR